MSEYECRCLVCVPVAPAWKERDERIRSNVVQYGWHVMGVGGEDVPADWAYSIGLWHSRRSPEICVLGIPVEPGMHLVNSAANAITEDKPLILDQRRDDVIENFDVVMRPVHPDWYRAFFGAGIDFQQGASWPVAQMFWPDKAGRFPWDDDVEEYCRSRQPLLWIPPGETAGAWAKLAAG